MFAELHAKSHYSFLQGASSPEQLVLRAFDLGYSALALTDECSYAGVVKAYQASKACGLKLIVGSEFLVSHEHGAFKLVLLATNRLAYSEISALITRARRRCAKGEYRLTLDDLRFGLQRCLAIWLPDFSVHKNLQGKHLSLLFKDRLWLGVELFRGAEDQQHYFNCHALSEELKINMVACNDVHMHCKLRKPLQDTLTAIRLNTSVQALGNARQINAERYLKPLAILSSQYPASLLTESLRIAEQCNFSMDELQYEYPRELVPLGLTPSRYLRDLTIKGAAKRWPHGVSNKVKSLIDKELKLIEELSYEYYFLTVYDIVAFARAQKILCQGRGSAANSAVCYCLFITEVDPDSNQLLFERFISKERNEPPDIDVDFDNQRREEVIQYIYRKYTRKRTALTATVISYRRRSAIKDVGKALGLPLNFIEELNRSIAWWDNADSLRERMLEQKLNLNNELIQQFLKLVKQIIGTPRHLSQHVGGFLITHSPISTLVPVENAAMPERTVIQWDKYDIEILGLLKVDVLGLGMLSAIQKTLAMINDYSTTPICLQDIPKEDPQVYDMLCAGDSIGVFQVESRAQMSMLPRLKPRNYYDLVIQVAIIRPGPIQGDMVHPYLRRRDGTEDVNYPNAKIKSVLKRTLGVPIFQEQVIQLTMVAAGFSGGEADQLRRAMASWGKLGTLDGFEKKLIDGMLKRGYELDFAQRLFKQIKGFGAYGFPESHSASFAILVYFSSWLKCYHPAAFYAGLLNSQPMGFYSPSQLIQDARRHKVRVLPICINNSGWQHSLDIPKHSKRENSKQDIGLRLGLRLVKGVKQSSALTLIDSRNAHKFISVEDIKSRHLISQDELTKLINANALHEFDNNRRHAYWLSLNMDKAFNVPARAPFNNKETKATIAPLNPLETLIADYRSAHGVSLQYHPMQLLRNTHPFSRCTLAQDLLNKNNKGLIEVAGVVTGRQRPGTASGVIFMTLEDETGNINVVLWSNVQERFKRAILSSKLLYIKGTIEHQHGVANVVAGYVECHDAALPRLKARSRNFH